MSTISTPSSGSEYASISDSSFGITSSAGSFFRDGATVLVNPPSVVDGPLNGTGGAKFERGCTRLAEVPAIAGPNANGPLATNSTGGRGAPPRPSPPLPLPLPRPRPRADSVGTGVGLVSWIG